MRKILSVFYLAARPSFYKILILTAVSGIVQYFFFANELNTLKNSDIVSSGYPDLEHLISLSAINVIFAVTFALVLFLLSVTGTAIGSKCNYTLSRLSVSETTYFAVQSLYNAIVLVFLLGFEIVLCFGFCVGYINQANESFISNQTVFLAFYRNDFLHSLLPLSDLLIWIRNVLQIIALSISASFFSYKQRRGKKSVAVIFLALFSVIWNSGEVGGSLSVIMTYMICVCIAVFVFLYIKNRWGENDEYAD